MENALCRVDNNNNTIHITKENGLVINILNTLYEDREENWWIVTNTKGVSKLNSLMHVSYYKNEGLESEAILQFIPLDIISLYCLTMLKI